MQDDDAYDMATGHWRSLIGRYGEEYVRKWKERIGAPDNPTPERAAEDKQIQEILDSARNPGAAHGKD